MIKPCIQYSVFNCIVSDEHLHWPIKLHIIMTYGPAVPLDLDLSIRLMGQKVQQIGEIRCILSISRHVNQSLVLRRKQVYMSSI